MASRRQTSLHIGGILLVLAISGLIYAFRDETNHLLIYGYPGIFLVALLSNATIILPVPGLAITLAMTSVLPPAGVALAAASGAALGELSGYLGGLSGQAIIARQAHYQRIAPYVQRYGAFAIFLLAAIPNPFFDLAGIAAGAVHMPLGRFLFACWLGQLVKMFTLAYAGAISWQWLLH